ncbi:sugar isomerase [Flavobacterium sp. TSSA_36]|uniref:sugar isomerase n=1 Tax=Flavobacterium sp. TSSA_36 TaxID=3447669 RepID=UPI003F5FD68A
MEIKQVYKNLGPDKFFMITMFVVNFGNYFYNLLLGRILGPAAFADAAILITLLLVLSFVGMTFQIVSAKYAVLFSNSFLSQFLRFIATRAVIFGSILAVFGIVFSGYLSQILNTQTSIIFTLFSFSLPFYFLMSVNRGLYQGQNNLFDLSKTYFYEMFCRLSVTFCLLYFFPKTTSSVFVSIGILISIVVGLIPFQKIIMQPKEKVDEPLQTKPIVLFFLITACYEFTLIIINNSDILLVKHYFDNYNAGLYASLALIGRVVYFVAWMFVMLLLPKVILLKKEGKATHGVLFKYVFYVVILATIIVGATFLFPELMVKILFGNDYLSIANLLWKYALATSVFAISNIFAYYFLSIQKYFPVALAAFFGGFQIVLILLYHSSLEQVVSMQLIAMFLLLLSQTLFFLLNKNNSN